MEFPFGRDHHHHHHNRPDPNEEYPAPPPPAHQPPFGYEGPPPAHQPYGYEGPPPAHQPYGYRPDNSLDPYGAPPPPMGHHVSHEGSFGSHGHGHGYPHQPKPEGYGGSYVQHVGHEGGPERSQPTVRVYTKADENYSLSVRDGKVVLAKSDPSDPYQHWIKDLKYSTKVKDEEGFPSFALVNKVTGEAIKHSIGATHPVRLIPYNPDYLDESVLWTESKDLGDGFRCIRMVNNITLNFDAFHGDEDHGGVRDGTTLVLWEWLKGKNQRWNIVPYCEFSSLECYRSYPMFFIISMYNILICCFFIAG